MTEQEARAAERESVMALLQLDLLLLKSDSPQAFLDRALSLIRTRHEQAK
jgi:hypothetical protein